MIINNLVLESKVQVGDVTRLDASRTFLVKGSSGNINSVKIKAGLTAAEVDVNHQDSSKWFLDIAYQDASFDINAAIGLIKFTVNDVEYSTNVPDGTYTLDTLLAAIKIAVEAVASPLTLSYVVDDTGRVLFTPSKTLRVLPSVSYLWRLLGFLDDHSLDTVPVAGGLKIVALTTTTNQSETTTTFYYQEVLTAAGDALYAHDADLTSEETDILKWTPRGRASFLNVHRQAQSLIVDFIDRAGFKDDKGRKLTKFAFVDKTDVNQWAKYLALRLIFNSIRNAENDVFKEKAKYYESLEIECRNRFLITLDTNNNGKAEPAEYGGVSSARLYLR